MSRVFVPTIFVAFAIGLAGCATPPAISSATPAISQANLIHPNVVVHERGLQPDTPTGLSPAELESAYDLPSSSKGKGQIIAVVEAYDNPNVASDLAQYRSTFGLPAANFTKYNQNGQTGDYPQGSPDWGIEIDLDVEMVSASCPNCTIDLVEANSNGAGDLEAAVAEAVKLGAHVVSVSWGCEGSGCVDQSYFEAKGVEYVAASGDSGVGLPAAFDNVVATGGTILLPGGAKRQKVFGDGGCTTEPKPKWQHFPQCDYRLANDVASAAYNLAEYDTYDAGGWIEIDGTAASAPFLAGVFGLAGNAAKQDGGRTFWVAAHHKYLYPVEQGASSCALRKGRYNTCTGWGTPHGIGAF